MVLHEVHTIHRRGYRRICRIYGIPCFKTVVPFLDVMFVGSCISHATMPTRRFRIIGSHSNKDNCRAVSRAVSQASSLSLTTINSIQRQSTSAQACVAEMLLFENIVPTDDQTCCNCFCLCFSASSLAFHAVLIDCAAAMRSSWVTPS